MAKGFGGMGGMNMNALMKQAQKMQKQMEETQAALADQVIETTSGGGAVKVSITGKKEIKEIKIRQADEVASGAMSKITGGNLGGMF